MSDAKEIIVVDEYFRNWNADDVGKETSVSQLWWSNKLGNENKGFRDLKVKKYLKAKKKNYLAVPEPHFCLVNRVFKTEFSCKNFPLWLSGKLETLFHNTDGGADRVAVPGYKKWALPGFMVSPPGPALLQGFHLALRGTWVSGLCWRMELSEWKGQEETDDPAAT